MEYELDLLKSSLESLEGEMVAEVNRRSHQVEEIHPRQIPSWKNLLHYMVLRREDRRDLQLGLHNAGLSALSNSESHVRYQVQAIRRRLGEFYEEAEIATCTYPKSREILEENVSVMFGSQNSKTPSIMVTLDSQNGSDAAHLAKLMQEGMGVARINLAHESEAEWRAILDALKKAEKISEKTCKIYMDLAGPKIRTEFLGKQAGEKQLKISEGALIFLAGSREGFEEKKQVVISPTEVSILPFLKEGERVLIDDGKIQGIIESKGPGTSVGIRILKIFKKKPTIKQGKGINFPDSQLKIDPLTDYDLGVLPFAVKEADLIGYSFVNRPRDLAHLVEEMRNISGEIPPVILKIETALAVKNLPALLIEGMKLPHIGVMIARGDLAVEVGFERMSEVQDEIMWICEAAHAPVIWATQVMESLQKSGLATRAEITDASKAALAECIMINKGPHTSAVLQSLRDIIDRMGAHRDKKRYTFRALKIATRFLTK
ncbi:pyruvate kinase [Algoriphagus faecimaris]|uniref:Pyruvate kinase n=1 Tax=Algoriphagus faecimaris TaxID=686796 RepID=A0A1G6VLA4_9BACT|nr:pyruvate kinase [Algoriphagus faecimaris]SDD54392.1 pyruvate kinase [Algoriphagus faecimaris]